MKLLSHLIISLLYCLSSSLNSPHVWVRNFLCNCMDLSADQRQSILHKDIFCMLLSMALPPLNEFLYLVTDEMFVWAFLTLGYRLFRLLNTPLCLILRNFQFLHHKTKITERKSLISRIFFEIPYYNETIPKEIGMVIAYRLMRLHATDIRRLQIEFFGRLIVMKRRNVYILQR